ncbi:MAG: alpha/beta hydrolase-fold protein [Thermoanaerobaculia bacterium]|nr:alpha/beta hydrolase-fold protein [Thermoanaerobaculia bacterium]
MAMSTFLRMDSRIYFLVFAALLSPMGRASDASAEEPREDTREKVLAEKRTVTEYRIAGHVEGEERVLQVHTPKGYEQSVDLRFPVLYVLDSERNLPHTLNTVEFLTSRRKMPATLVVGLPNPSDDARRRDYKPRGPKDDGVETGGADAFLRDLEQRLIPFVEQRYRTLSFRMLAGHSRSGLFALHSLIERPELFHARFAFSPALWHDGEAVLPRAEEFLRRSSARRSFWFMNLGGKENPNITHAYLRMHDVLNHSAQDWLRWYAPPIAADESHGTTPAIGMYRALRRLFTGYSLSVEEFQNGGIQAVFDHTNRTAEELGFRFPPRSDLVNSAGYFHLERQEVEQALTAFELNLRLSPNDPNVYDSLADGLEAAGRLDDARDAATKACRMAREISDPRQESFCEHHARLIGAGQSS